MKKRILSMLLCICMVCTLLPVKAWAAAGDHADKIKVAGTELTATGYYDVSDLGTMLEAAPASPSSNGYVHWDSSTGTLTLYGATIDGGDSSSGIYANQNYTIMLSENTVSNVTSGFTNAVTSDGSVTIKGSGTLNAIGATNGIDADYTVSITDGATVNAIGTNGMGIFISLSYSYWDGLKIESDAASVTIAGKTYGVGYANTSTLAPPEIKSPNVTVTGETAAFQIAPTLNGVGAKASNNFNGDAPETYDSAKLSNYKWFKSEALASVSVNSVTVDPASLSLTVGDSSKLTATVAPTTATNQNVTWSSSDASVATVYTDGNVTAVAEGTATITATTEDGGFTATCTVTVSAAAPSVTNYDLWVGGVQVTSANAADILNDGKVSYDATTDTLTLNNTTITGDDTAAKKEGIYSYSDLKIVLQGENTVTSGTGVNAIIAGGSLTFKGTGKLHATSSNYCIQAHGGDINISGVTVNAIGTGKNARGIVAFENAGTGGDITITNATVTAKGEPYGICASGDITISSSTVIADATTTRQGVSVHAIYGGNITITDSTVTVTAECINWGSYGISGSLFNGCKITITDSTVTAKTVAEVDGTTSKVLSMAPVFGDTPNWYQWTTTENGAMTKSSDTSYTYDESHSYLKIEPIAASVTVVTLDKSTLDLTVGESSATVDQNGNVTAVAEGTATITATAEDGSAATCVVTVNAVSHNYTAQIKKEEALKTAGNCRDNAVYYYSCVTCGAVENDNSHTFEGDKDPDTHVGGSHVEGASEPDHKTQTAGSTGATICNGCNATLISAQAIQPDAHTPANAWSHDKTDHWQECAVVGCGFVIDNRKAAHTPDRDAATETDAVKCSVCGYVMTPALDRTPVFGHIHTYGRNWKSNKEKHWNECACGDKDNLAAHKDENKDGKCDVCAYNVDVPTTSTDRVNPQTGDDGMMWMWIALLFVSGFGLVKMTLLDKKRFFTK